MSMRRRQASRVILVQGAWAHYAEWSAIIPSLQYAGLTASALDLPQSSLAQAATMLRRAITKAEGAVILVGHSYGGAIISEAGLEDQVVGLVYVAAFAPDIGEPPACPSMVAELMAEGTFEHHAGQLPNVTLKPTPSAPLSGLASEAAWRVKPSWYLVENDDRALSRELQCFTAHKINAATIMPASNLPSASASPKEISEIILEAAGL